MSAHIQTWRERLTATGEFTVIRENVSRTYNGNTAAALARDAEEAELRVALSVAIGALRDITFNGPGTAVLIATKVLAQLIPKTTRGSAGAYFNGSDQQRAQIDAAIRSADALLGSHRENRDRRKGDQPYGEISQFDRRQGDRRSLLRSDNKSNAAALED